MIPWERAEGQGASHLGEGELLAVVLIVLVKAVGADLLQADEVLVGVKGVRLQLDHGHGEVGAVVGHPLIVGQKVVEDEALGELADPPLEPVHVVELHLVAQGVDELLQGLDPVASSRSPVVKAVMRCR